MDFRIARAALAAIRTHAATARPDEACGLLVGRAGEVLEAVAAANVAADPQRRFEVDPATLLATHRAARSRGLAVIGCYHSHPQGLAEPSACDAARARDLGWLWLIATSDAVGAFLVVDAGPVRGRFAPVGLIAIG